MEKYLPKLQKCELEILNEIVRICNKYNINYFLSGGTLLGAVRHKGFIPWDDDIDIGMLRNDFNRFVKICKSELNSRFLLDCYDTNKYYMLPFAKVRIKNSLMIEKSAINRDNNPGIWVDIFIFDDIKELDIKKIEKKKKLHDRYTTLISIKLKIDYYDGKQWKKKIHEMLLKFIPLKVLIYFANCNITSGNSDNPKYIIDFSSIYDIKKEIFKIEKIFPLKKLKFENKLYNVPNDYDYVLSQKYGDYMQLPPVDKRRTHPPFIVRFEDGEEYKYDK